MIILPAAIFFFTKVLKKNKALLPPSRDKIKIAACLFTIVAVYYMYIAIV
jgi:hypothetical protein